MNQLVVLLLAVCLISVQAFVKRDTAPAAEQTVTAEKFGKDVQALAQNLQNEITKAFEPVAKAFDPEKMNTEFRSLLDQVQETLKGLAPKEGPKA